MSISEDREKVILICVDTGNEAEAEMSVRELERLADTAGADTVAVMIQKRPVPSPSTYIGQGKVEEIKAFLETNEADTIIADDELSGIQIRNLEDATDLKVIDRTSLILDIFAQRARSAQGKLQVELAQLWYKLPRLVGEGKEMSRLGGGIGTRGPGESKLETDKRHIKRRIYHITEELKRQEERHAISAKNRRDSKIPTCALVGYTNAGKSSLMNVLCKSDVYAEDKLFATLDPTVRQMDGEPGILMVDTVGFIRKLPHALIESFKSTLDESLSADLLLHVADISDPEMESNVETVNKLLFDMNAEQKPVIMVLNKCDRSRDCSFMSVGLGRQDIIAVSAKTGENIDELREEIISRLLNKKHYRLLIPYSKSALSSFLYEKTEVLEADHREEGTYFRIYGSLSDKDKDMLKDYFI